MGTEPITHKASSKAPVIALGIVCIVALTALAGMYLNYTSVISGKDSTIASYSTQITNLQNQLAATPKNWTAFVVAQVSNMNLTLVGASGQQVVLHAKDIAALNAYTGSGGYKSKTGTISGVGNYTGVPILTLCNLVGGLTSSNSIRVFGSDNFNTTFTYQKSLGGVNTYNPTTGASQNGTVPLTMVAAYFLNGAKLASTDGPLRVAFIGPQGLLTDGSNGAKLLVKIQIL